LLGYDFTIEYKPGTDNIHVNSLSKPFHMAWSQPQFHIVTKLNKLYRMMIDCKRWQSYVQQIGHMILITRCMIVFYIWKTNWFSLMRFSLKQQIVHECHNSLVGDHAGYTRILARVIV